MLAGRSDQPDAGGGTSVGTGGRSGSGMIGSGGGGGGSEGGTGVGTDVMTSVPIATGTVIGAVMPCGCDGDSPRGRAGAR